MRNVVSSTPPIPPPRRSNREGLSITDQRLLRERLLTAGLWLALVSGVITLLYIGKDFLVPLILAVIGVYLMKIVAGSIHRFRILNRAVPEWLAMVLAFIFIGLLGYGLVVVVAENALAVAEEAPRYQKRLVALEQKLADRFEMEDVTVVQDAIRGIDLGAALGNLATTLTSLLGRSSLIMLYVVFILLEGRFFHAKFRALFPERERREWVSNVLRRIDRDIHTYLGVKTFVSLVTAVLSYFLMKITGLKFAEFWALVVFVLNFIPTLGSIISTILPALVALLQFDSLASFLVILIGLTVIQQLMGSFVDPSLMGESLNVSPLVVILSLIFWGSLWGIPGMFLCVPLTVILMIVLSNFQQTRWVAVLLSKNGRIIAN